MMSGIKHLVSQLLSRDNSRWVKLSLVAVFALIVFGTASVAVAADQTTKNGRERLVTINDNGTERTILTRAVTVEDALKAANIEVVADDNIEPKIDAELNDSSAEINVYRARPIVVVDGSQTVRVVTMAQSEAAIAAVAGIKLYPEDKTSIEPVRDVLSSGGAGLQLKIARAKVVNLKLYGEISEMRTHVSTVREFLDEKNITLGPDDVVSLDLDAAIYDQMNLEVWRNGIQTITVDEEITFEVEQVRDMNLEVGYREVKEAGISGQRSVVYEIEMKNGEEISRREIQSVVTKQPTKQVEVIGVKVSLPPGGHSDWMRAAGIAESDFGYANSIISRESGWGVTKSNYAGSGAYGLCQALPGSKMASAGADWATNPITQLRWCNGYAVGRYGSWAGAYEFWQRNHWW